MEPWCRSCVSLLAAALAVVAAHAQGSSAQAQHGNLPTIAVAGPSNGPQPSAEPRFARAVQRQLEALEGVRVMPPRSARYVLRGAVTHLGRGLREGEPVVRCEVSVLVAERRTGAIRAILTGRATTRAGDSATLASRLIDAAVRAALKPLPDKLAGGAPLALKRTP